MLAVVGDAHTYPAAHWFVRSAVLASAKQDPAEHATQLASEIDVAPPADHLPAGHGFAAPVDWPATQ